MQTRSVKSCIVDTGGNVIVIAAAALIPLMALIGGGVDTGRAYMAKTQLQSACDAGVLAGRRAMSATGSYGSAEIAKADAMFNFNFDSAAVDASGVTFVTNANAEGQVSGVANASLPTVVMAMFGKETIGISADCMAELQIANADVMFVLDTTGSMGGSRIAGLRSAVKDFHKTMNSAIKDANTRVRYGFVPYSMAVNAKDLITNGDMPVSYFVDSAPYETREAQFNTPIHVGTTVNLGLSYETYNSDIKDWQCTDYGQNDYPNNKSNPETSGSAPGKVTTRSYSWHSWVGSGTKRTCTRKVYTTETTYVTKFSFSNWRYKESDLDTSSFKTFASVPIGTDVSSAYADQAGYYDMVDMAKKNGSILHNVGTTNTVWDGCIEERDTVDDASWDPIPSGAFDLDLSFEPNSDETRWRPMWQGAVYLRNHHQHEDATGWRSNAYSACPSPMQLFTEVELSDDPDDVPEWLNTYLNGLVATGNTYHDIGLIWGGRLSSSRGIFADNVNKDDKAVSRHLIFMTDGKLEPYIWGYNSYGIETLSNRIAPHNSDTAAVTARHNARFLAACEEVKSQGSTLWVIAFGTTLTDDLKTCSSDGRAYHSSNTTSLQNTFKYIASQVANLRLGQ